MGEVILEVVLFYKVVFSRHLLYAIWNEKNMPNKIN